MKDDVAFAYVDSDRPIENSIILEDGINPESILAHKFIDGNWVQAPLIHFIERISNDGIVEKTNSTVYSSDVTGEIIPWHVGPGWKKESGEWINFVELEQQKHKDEQIQNAIQNILSTRPHTSWNWVAGEWVPPVPRPEINPENYYWDEASLSWQEYVDSTDSSNEIEN